MPASTRSQPSLSLSLPAPLQVLYSNNTGLVLDCLARGEPPPVVDWVDDAGHVLPLMPSVARRLHNGEGADANSKHAVPCQIKRPLI